LAIKTQTIDIFTINETPVTKKERVMSNQLTDDQVEKLFDYVEKNNLADTIGLQAHCANEPEVFDKNLNLAHTYLKEHNLLNGALGN
jgi:hypothetical protein